MFCIDIRLIFNKIKFGMNINGLERYLIFFLKKNLKLGSSICLVDSTFLKKTLGKIEFK